MLVQTQNIRLLLQCNYQFTTISRRHNTPRVFKNPKLTQYGILKKQPRSYNYDLPENLPNRHLYWNRSLMNQIYRKRYNKQRLLKLNVNPIHNQNGDRTFQRELPEIIAELASVRLIKASLGRTMANVYEAISRFQAEFVGKYQGKKFIRGQQFDVLQYTINEINQRHLPTMDFYTFSTFCQLRHLSKIKPSEQILFHFFKYLQGMKAGNTIPLSLERLGQLSKYIFSREYPKSCQQIFYKTKKIEFNLFEDTDPETLTFEDIVPELFTPDELTEKVKQFQQKNPNETKRKFILEGIRKLPGGEKLLEKLPELIASNQ